MKIFFLLISIFIFSFSSLYSQSKSFTGGVFANANGIHFEGDKNVFWQSPNGKVAGGGGLSSGIYVKRNITGKFYFGFELRYIQKGSVFEYSNQLGNRSVETMRLNYAEVPLILGYTFQTNKSHFSIETGIAYGKQISSEIHLNKLTSSNQVSDIDNFRDDDFSWVGNLKFPLNNKRKNNLLLGVRTSYSLKSIHKIYNLRNLTYGIQLDYLFR